MRITQSILYRQALQDVQHNLLGSAQLQTDIASGVRVHRPSDDPAAMLRILPLQGELRNLDQSLANIQLAAESMTAATSALEEGSELMQRVRELTVQGANGTLSESDRLSLADEIDQALAQMISVGNTSRAGRYLFGGTASDNPPFELRDAANGARVLYRGNAQTLSVPVAPSIEAELNLPGDAVFRSQRRGATTFAGTTGAASAAGIDTGVGADNLRVTARGLTVPGTVAGIAQGSGSTTALGTMNYTFTAPDQLSINGGPTVNVINGENSIKVGADSDRVISLNLTLPITPTTGSFVSEADLSIDGGTTTTAVDFSQSTVQLTDSVDGSILNVDVTGLNTVGVDYVRYEGTFDVFSTLVAVRDLLRNDAQASSGDVTARLSHSLGDIDDAHDGLLSALRDLGSRGQNMNLLRNRIEGMKINASESLSNARDTDIVEAMLSFNQQDTIYQASLRVSAQIVQVSLLNFLR